MLRKIASTVAIAAVFMTASPTEVGFAEGSFRPIEASVIQSDTVQTVNVTDTGFWVTWVTDSEIPGSGSITYALTPGGASITNVSESTVQGAKGDIHVVKVANLTPSTTYYYSVSEGGAQDNNGGDFYRVDTGPTLTDQLSNLKVSGSVKATNGLPATGVLITLHLVDYASSSNADTSANLAAFTDPQGAWSIQLLPRTLDGSAVFQYRPDGSGDALKYSVAGGSQGVIGVQTVLLKSDNGNLQAPQITLLSTLPTSTTTATPTITLTSTITWTPSATPTSTPNPADKSLNESATATPSEPAVPTETAGVVSPAFEQPANAPPTETSVPGVPTLAPFLPPTRIPVPPTPVPIVEAATPVPVVEPATRVAVVEAASAAPNGPPSATPTEEQLVTPGQPAPFVNPQFPFAGTPLPGGIADIGTPVVPFQSPAATVTGTASPRSSTTSTARGTATTDTVPPLARTLFAVGLVVFVVGIVLVSVGVTRMRKGN
jgi:hypothetical protein